MKKIKILKKYIFLIFLVFIFFIFFNGAGSNQNQISKIINACASTDEILIKYNIPTTTDKIEPSCVIKNNDDTSQQIAIKKDKKLNIFFEYTEVKTTKADYQQNDQNLASHTVWKKLYNKQSREFLFYDANNKTIQKITKQELLTKIISYYKKNQTSKTLEIIDNELNITRTIKYKRIIKLNYLNIDFSLEGEKQSFIYWIKDNKIEKIKKIKLNADSLQEAKQELLRSNKINQTENLSFRSNSYFYFETEKFAFLSNKPSFDIILYARKKGINGTEFTKLYNSENNHFYLLNEKNNILKLNIREQYQYIKNFKNFNLDKENYENTDLIFKKDFAYIRTKLYLDNKSKKLNRVSFFLNENTKWKTFELPKKGFFLWFGKINQTKNKLLSIYKKLSKLSIIGFGSGGGLIFVVLILYGIKKLSDRRY